MPHAYTAVAAPYPLFMKDALDRRSRFSKPQPIDRSIELTERDHALFAALARHGHLPTPYLYEFTKHICKDKGMLQHRLTQLYNGYCDHPDHRSNNPDGHVCKAKHFLDRHPHQYDNFRARYQHLVYHLSPLGHQACTSPVIPFRRSNSFVHDLFLGCFTASFELLAPRFIFRDEILKKAGKTSIALGDLVPDDLFGIEYPEGGYRFFALEIDRATERINTKITDASSIAKKIAGYTDTLASRHFKDDLAIPNLSVLIATTNPTRASNMLQYVDANSSQANKFLFNVFSDFGDNWRVPNSLLPVFEPWRSVRGELDISKRATA